MIEIYNIDYKPGDIAGLIIFGLIIISVAIGSIFGAKWYIWGPKWKAKWTTSKKARRLKRDGGADLSHDEKVLLKKDDSTLSSQELLTKHKAESKVSKAQEIENRRKENALKEKEEKKIQKTKDKEILKNTKLEEKEVRQKQKEQQKVKKENKLKGKENTKKK